MDISYFLWPVAAFVEKQIIEKLGLYCSNESWTPDAVNPIKVDSIFDNIF